MSALPDMGPTMLRAGTSTPVQNASAATSIDLHSMEQAPAIDIAMAVNQALARCGMSHKQAALTMGVDASLWSKQLRGDGHISLQRLALLPAKFWREFVPMLASTVHLTVSHPDFEEAAIGKVVELVAAIGQVLVHRNARRIA